MALSPVTTATVNYSANTISITDATGVYNVTTNPTGWETPNLGGSGVSTAIINIIYANGGTQQVDVTSQIPATVTGSFTFTDIVMSGYTDGITTISYTITDSSGVDVSYDLTLLFTFEVRCCIDKMWSDVACQTCAGNCDLRSLVDDANLAEGLFNALNSGAATGSSCCDNGCINKILTSLKDLCSWNNCNC